MLPSRISCTTTSASKMLTCGWSSCVRCVPRSGPSQGAANMPGTDRPSTLISSSARSRITAASRSATRSRNAISLRQPDDGFRTGAQVNRIRLRLDLHTLAEIHQLLLGVVRQARRVDRFHIVSRRKTRDEELTHAFGNGERFVVTNEPNGADSAPITLEGAAPKIKGVACITTQLRRQRRVQIGFLDRFQDDQRVPEAPPAQHTHTAKRNRTQRVFNRIENLSALDADLRIALVERERDRRAFDLESLDEILDDCLTISVEDLPLDRADTVIFVRGIQLPTHLGQASVHDRLNRFELALRSERTQVLDFVCLDRGALRQMHRVERQHAALVANNDTTGCATNACQHQSERVAVAFDLHVRRGDALFFE